MLADDAPPKINQVIAGQPSLSRQQTAHSTLPLNQIGVGNQQPEINNQTWLPPMEPNQTNGLSTQNSVGQKGVNFGWEQINNGPLLPFVIKDSKRYVAWYIVVEKVFKIILDVFSPEMLSCLPFKVAPMSESEALIFNEINILHCDRGLIGNYVFHDGYAMLPLEEVKRYVKYFHACRKSMIYGVNNNNLFGFIRVNQETEIPFIWEGKEKLVPQFYFEGTDAKVLSLNDPWKLGYFKFCFKVQKIRRDLYKNNFIDVIFFHHVEKMFPEGSTFELCWPKSINQDLLNPEMQAKLFPGNVPPGVGVAKERLAKPTTKIKANKTPHLSASNFNLANKTSTLQPSKLQTTNQLEKSHTIIHDCQPAMRPKSVQESNQLVNPHSVILGDQLSSLGRATTISVNRLEENIIQQTGIEYTKSDQRLATPIPQAESNRSDDIPQDHRAAREIADQQTSLERSLQRSNDHIATKKVRQFASNSITAATNMHDRFYTNRLVEEDLITNVPRRSPQVATSPGVQQTSPYMMAATEPIQRYAQSSNVASTGSPSDLIQQQCMSHQSYPPQQSNIHQGQFLNQRNHQGRDLQNSGFIQQQHLVQDHQKEIVSHFSANNSRLVEKSPSSSKTVHWYAGASGPQFTEKNSFSQDRLAHVQNVPAINRSVDIATSIGHPTRALTTNRPNGDGSLVDPLEGQIQQPSSQTSLLRVEQSSSDALRNNSSNRLYQQGEVTLSADPLDTHILQLAYEQSILTKNLQQNKQTLKLLRQQKRKQKETETRFQQNSVANNHFLSASNNQPYENTLSVSTELQSVTSSQPAVHQQDARDIIPVVQNVNVAVTNVLVTDRDGNNYHPASTSLDNYETTKVQLTFLVPDHILNIDTFKETYSAKKFSLKKMKDILGIRMSLLANEFLINFRDFASITIATNDTSTLYKLATRFKVLYKLNPVQKVLWDEWSIERKCLHVDDFLYDVFVKQREAMLVFKNLNSTPLNQTTASGRNR